jgi:hypothetical protein
MFCRFEALELYTGIVSSYGKKISEVDHLLDLIDLIPKSISCFYIRITKGFVDLIT